MEDSLGTILKLLIYLEGAMVAVWFGLMFLVHLIEGLKSIGPAADDPEDKKYMINRFVRAIFDAIFVVAAAAVVLYIHVYY